MGMCSMMGCGRKHRPRTGTERSFATNADGPRRDFSPRSRSKNPSHTTNGNNVVFDLSHFDEAYLDDASSVADVGPVNLIDSQQQSLQ
jgi:hypothetical protein